MKLLPIISEKSMTRSTDNNVYSFIVDKTMNKTSIASYIHQLFNVDISNVRIINRVGKIKRTKQKFGKRSDVKIALIKLKIGQKIEGFALETPNEEKSKANDKPKTKTEKKII